MKTTIMKHLIIAAAVLGLTWNMAGPAMAESYSASAMRLLHYEGDVEILDASGSPRFVMENVRFDSGEAMRTGKDSSASVGMDESRIVSLDEETTVEFVKKSNAMELNLKEGKLLLDVQEKLDENETFDIQTATMVVGIRGTVLFVTSEKSEAGLVSRMGVLEGTAQVTYREASGSKRQVPVPAGMKVMLHDPDGDGNVDTAPEITAVTQADLNGFPGSVLESEPALRQRVEKAGGIRLTEEAPGSIPSEDSWTWEEPVTLVAQSASKLYDGQPLTRTGDVLVYGLPSDFSIEVSASGSQTDAGTSVNRISSYKIYNPEKDDVTEHFKNINTVDGSLRVDPAPLCVWTGSAEKVYDGTPLTDKDALLRTTAGYEREEKPWRNSSYVVTESGNSGASGNGQTFYDNETLYGICGTVWVHGTNPLTGETREIELPAGKRMTVHLHDDNDKQSIEFVIETIEEDEIPEEILRLYSDNPELLSQACKDTGWDPDKITERARLLTPVKEGKTEKAELSISGSLSDRLMQDSTNVRINIDTTITNYNDRSLGSDEAKYTPVSIDSSIIVKAEGSRTSVGQSKNTYTIRWGNVNPANFVLSEDLGTLTVTPAHAVVATGSGSKVYDGTPLTVPEASITGLVNGESAVVTATGSQTEAGKSLNTYEISWGQTNSGNYTLAENLGTLTVTAAEKSSETEPVTEPEIDTEVTFTAASAEKEYDGIPLSDADVTADGLPEGYTFEASAKGSQTDAGSSRNTVSSYIIRDRDGKDVTKYFTNIETEDGILTVTPRKAVVTTLSAAKEYDGTALNGIEGSVMHSTGDETGSDTEAGITKAAAGKNTGAGLSDAQISAAITGLTKADAKEVSIVATGTITDLGTIVNGYRINWGNAKKENYSLKEKLGTLEVKKNTSKITITSGSDEKVYDGTALRCDKAEVEGLLSGFTCRAEMSGSQTDAGSSDNTVSSYKILNSAGKDVTAAFANIDTASGTLKVTPAAVKVTTESAVKEYDGTELSGAAAGASITGLAASDQKEVAITATGSITDVGSTENTCTISWGNVKKSNYTLSEEHGTLEVRPNTSVITFTAASAEKAFDGTALSDKTVTAPGLPAALTFEAEADGSQTDAGSSGNSVTGYKILDADGKDVTAFFTNIQTANGTLTVVPLQLNIDLGGTTLVYDGESHDPSLKGTYGNGTHAGEAISISGEWSYDGEGIGVRFSLFTGDALAVECYGGAYDAGTVELSEEHHFEQGNEQNYTVSCTNNTITIKKAVLTITTGSKEKEYDGSPLTCEEITVTGLVPADEGWYFSAEATGSQTEIGDSKNTYSIYWGYIYEGNYIIEEKLGTLKVTKPDQPSSEVSPLLGSKKRSSVRDNEKRLTDQEKEDAAAAEADRLNAEQQEKKENTSDEKAAGQTGEKPAAETSPEGQEEGDPGTQPAPETVPESVPETQPATEAAPAPQPATEAAPAPQPAAEAAPKEKEENAPAAQPAAEAAPKQQEESAPAPQKAEKPASENAPEKKDSAKKGKETGADNANDGE